MSACRTVIHGDGFHTVVMSESLLGAVIAAESANARLMGSDLRRAAESLATEVAGIDAQLWPVDAVAERIIGAADVLSRNLPPVVDRTQPALTGPTCVLVAGHLAGSVSLANAASTVRRLGAHSVVAIVLGGWGEAVEGVDRVASLTFETSHAA